MMPSILAKWVFGHPKKIVLLLLCLTLLGTGQISKLKNDPNPYLLPKTHPSRVAFEHLRANFTGSKDTFLILIESDDTVLSAEVLKSIQSLTDQFENFSIVTPKDEEAVRKMVPETEAQTLALVDRLFRSSPEDRYFRLDTLTKHLQDSPAWSPAWETQLKSLAAKFSPIEEVDSLSNTDNILNVQDTLFVGPIFEQIPQEAAGFSRIEREVLENELLRGLILSPDSKSTAIMLQLNIDESDGANQLALYKKAIEVVKAELPEGCRFYVGGYPVASANIAAIMEADSAKLFPAVLGLVVLCLLISFRTTQGILVPLLVVIFSLLNTLAIQAWLGIPMNIISSTLPVFLLSIGVADGIHFYSEYRDLLLENGNKFEALQQTVKHLAIPITLTSITTAIAFLAMSVTDIFQVRHFGMFVAVGVVIAMVYSLIFMPALLTILPTGKSKKTRQEGAIDRFFNAILARLHHLSLHHSGKVLLVSLLILLGAGAASTLIHVDNDPIGYFGEQSDLVKATKKLNETMVGSYNLNILLSSKTDTAGAFKTPANLQAVLELENRIEQDPIVGKTISLAKVVKRLNYVLHDYDAAENRIPGEQVVSTDDQGSRSSIPGKQLIAQYLFLYENGGADTLSDLVNNQYSQINLSVVLRSNSSWEVAQLMERISGEAKGILPPDLQLTFSGTPSIEVATTEEIVQGQVMGFAGASLAIFLLLSFFFKSPLKGFFALIPIIVTVAVNFGIMGIFNVPLNIGTAVVSSIVIGIGVDYSIHYLSRLISRIKHGMDLADALQATSQDTGKAIILNAVTVGTGFVALLFSQFSPLFTMGWMISTTMLVSAFCTLLILPAGIVVFQKSFYVEKEILQELSTVS